MGCGKATNPYNPERWTKETWANELIELRKYLGLDQIHLLGQSWGGMLAFIYMCDYHPEGVVSLILSGTLPSAKLWAQEQHRMINNFMDPTEVQAIQKAEETGDYTDPAYVAANAKFMEQHAAATPTKDSPEPLRRKKVAGTESYNVAWGPNEYSPEGTLHDYDYMDQMKDIKTPTLITSGINDLCTPLIAKTMYDGIPNSKWELFAHSRHMPFVEENAKYERILTKWLNDHD